MPPVTRPRPPSSFSTTVPPFVENRGAVRPAPRRRRREPAAARTIARPGADGDAGYRRPPVGSVGSTLTQRMVLFKHPLHGAGWAGSGASSEARVRARREPSQAARPAAVTDPVTTKSAPARQAGLPAPRFLSNHRNAALPARGRRGGAAADSTESRGGNEPAERSVWRCSRDAGSHAADPDVVATAFASFPLPFLGAPRFAATVRSGTCEPVLAR